MAVIDLQQMRNQLSMELSLVNPQKLALLDQYIAGIQGNLLALTAYGYNWVVAEGEQPPLQEWPRMVYHQNMEPRVVNSQKEMDDLGPGWTKTVGGVVPIVTPPPAAAPPPASKRG